MWEHSTFHLVAYKKEKGCGELTFADCVSRRNHPVAGAEFYEDWEAMGRIFDQLRETIRRGFFVRRPGGLIRARCA